MCVRENCHMSGDRGGHHDAQSLVAPYNPTLEACYRGASKLGFFLSCDRTILCAYTVFVFCALLSKCACGTGKGVTGMLLFRQGTGMAQRPWQLFWDVVKHPYRRQSLPPATTTNTQPYGGLSGCHPVPRWWRQPQRYRQSVGISRGEAG